MNGFRKFENRWTSLHNSFDADVVCLQETKLSRPLVKEWCAFIPNYNSYFDFPKHRPGYSGVSTYCRNSFAPEEAKDSFDLVLDKEAINSYFDISDTISEEDLEALDSEGRIMITKHDIKVDEENLSLFIINVYCPRAREEEERFLFKKKFHLLLEFKALQILSCSLKNRVIILGDLNALHSRIDHCEGKNFEKNFEEHPFQEWFANMCRSIEGIPYFLDGYRYLYPDKKEAYTCWDTRNRARETNYGSRIDYFLVDNRLKEYIAECGILSDIMGSDHCPISLTLNVEPSASISLPPICTKNWPEFSTRQTTLFAYLTPNKPVESRKPYELFNGGTPSRKGEKKQSKLSGFLVTTKKSPSKIDKKENEEVGASSPESAINVGREAQSSSVQSQSQHSQSSNKAASLWKNILKGPPPAPLCKHGEKSVLKRVTTKGPNLGKQFYSCARPGGAPTNPEASCNFFSWVSK